MMGDFHRDIFPLAEQHLLGDIFVPGGINGLIELAEAEEHCDVCRMRRHEEMKDMNQELPARWGLVKERKVGVDCCEQRPTIVRLMVRVSRDLP
jgi:hypothetical protein